MENTNIEIRDTRIKERFFIDDLYLNGWAKKCGIYATGVYLSLCRHADRQQRSFPSLKRLSEELNISVRQVSRSLIVLESFRLIVRKRIGKKANNRYYLIDKSQWSDMPTSPITMDYQSNHHRTTSPIHSKDTHKKDTHSKEALKSFSVIQGKQRLYERLGWKK